MADPEAAVAPPEPEQPVAKEKKKKKEKVPKEPGEEKTYNTRLITEAAGFGALVLSILFAWLYDKFGKFHRHVDVDGAATIEWTTRKAQIAYFISVYLFKIFAWEACFPTYVGALVGTKFTSFLSYAIVLASGSYMLFASSFRIIHTMENKFLVLIVTAVILIVTVLCPAVLPRKIDGAGVRQILRGINFCYFVAYSTFMPFEWNNLEIAAQNLPTYESRVYESGADLYFIIVIVQFLEYLRLNWVKTIKYPINVSFCNIVLFYTSCIYAITLTIMFYAGCDSCHVAKAPPKSTESTTLVHPDKVCWWGEKASWNAVEFSNMLNVGKERKDRRNLRDFLDFSWPNDLVNKQFDTFDEFSPWHNFVKSGAFVNFFKTGIGLSLWNLYDTHQINFFNDFRHMVGIGWTYCFTKAKYAEHKVRCVGFFIKDYTHILTTRQCFEGRWEFLVNATNDNLTHQAAEFVVVYGSRKQRYKFPVFSGSVIPVDRDLMIIVMPANVIQIETKGDIKVPDKSTDPKIVWSEYITWKESAGILKLSSKTVGLTLKPFVDSWHDLLAHTNNKDTSVFLLSYDNREVAFSVSTSNLELQSRASCERAMVDNKQLYDYGIENLQCIKLNRPMNIKTGSIIARRKKEKIRSAFMFIGKDEYQFSWIPLGMIFQPISSKSRRYNYFYFTTFGERLHNMSAVMKESSKL